MVKSNPDTEIVKSYHRKPSVRVSNHTESFGRPAGGGCSGDNVREHLPLPHHCFYKRAIRSKDGQKKPQDNGQSVSGGNKTEIQRCVSSSQSCGHRGCPHWWVSQTNSSLWAQCSSYPACCRKGHPSAPSLSAHSTAVGCIIQACVSPDPVAASVNVTLWNGVSATVTELRQVIPMAPGTMSVLVGEWPARTQACKEEPCGSRGRAGGTHGQARGSMPLHHKPWEGAQP